MTVFDALALIGGLCLFLFGMNIMGQALERCAGSKLRTILGKLTTNKMTGFLTGLGVTAIIQSSSATTVMVVGFVNSKLMSLGQAINVIMGANVGTPVTAWILSLGGIQSDNIVLKLLKPTSFTPVLALVGIVFYLFAKSSRKKDVGTILLGFATLMFGMDAMSDAVSGLADVPAFQNLFLLFENPILGMLAGAILTGIIQSSSASVGILQALSMTGQVSYGAAVPIIMGQNIGTCVTALLSSVGTNKNARRAAVVHLSFNVIGTVVCLTTFSLVQAFLKPAILTHAADMDGIAICHTAFNILCTALLLPLSGLLEKLANILIPDSKDSRETDKAVELDERLLGTPSMALERCRSLTITMGEIAVSTMRDSIAALTDPSPQLAESVRQGEEQTDRYEDILGSYLIKLSAHQLGDAETAESAKLLRMIGDFERISDHSINVLESGEELHDKKLSFTPAASAELSVLTAAVNDILTLSLDAFRNNDRSAASRVEALEQVIDNLKEQLRSRHILRMQQGECTIEAGFVWSDLLTDLERISDHCSNIAGNVSDLCAADMNLHQSLRALRDKDSSYEDNINAYALRYALPAMAQASARS